MLAAVIYLSNKFFTRHNDVSTKMICTHVLHKGGHGVKSPVDMFVSGLGRSV